MEMLVTYLEYIKTNNKKSGTTQWAVYIANAFEESKKTLI